jgi:hypothetical protein
MMSDPKPHKSKPGLRFGILCTDTVFFKWQADAIRELSGHGHELVLLIRDVRHETPVSRIKHFWNAPWSSRLYNFAHHRFFHPPSKDPVDLRAELHGVDSLPCVVEKKGAAVWFSGADVEAIRSYELDFMLRFGFGIIRGSILQAAKYGIWSFHHDDEQKYRGGPPGFWEIYQNDPVNGFMLQRITEKLDAGIVLKKGFLRTVRHSYRGNLEKLLRASAIFPAQVADEILAGSGMPGVQAPGGVPLFRVPGNTVMVLFLIKLFLNKIRFHFRELFLAEIWNVGLISKPIAEIALGKEKLLKTDVKWLRQFGPTRYLADPSGFEEENKLHILVENYSYAKRKANISEIIWDPNRNSFTVPIRIIEAELHLSYPFVIEDEKVVYCIPESYRSGNVAIYKRNFSEESFVEENILLNDVDAIDPTLVYYENRWWLFFTIKEYSMTHLFVYYSDNLTSGYQPHMLNPVKIDIRSARPAGTPFMHEGILYRPAQDCTGTYGARVAINKVLKLTPQEFEEIPVSTVEPVSGSGFSKGLHTLSQVGKYTLVDGKCYRFNRYYFLHQLTKKILKLRKKDV